MKFKQVKFKGHAPCGFDGYGKVEDIAEKRLALYQKDSQYDIEVLGEVTWDNTAKTVADKPDVTWTAKAIKQYLDDNSISYTGTHDTKAKLIALIPTE